MCDLLDAERLAAALGAAVVGRIGVAAVRRVAHLLMDVPGALMATDDVGCRRRRVDRRRTGGAGGTGRTTVGRVVVLGRAGGVARQEALCRPSHHSAR